MPDVATIRLDLDVRDSLGRRLHPDALVVQEDRTLVLGSGQPGDLDVDNELDAAYMAIVAQKPLQLGRYLLRHRREDEPQWTYQAVVHDLDTRPSCRPGDVRRSLTAVGVDAVRRGLGTLAIEPIGCWHSKGLSTQEMVEAFDEAIVELSLLLEVPLRLTLLLEDLGQLEQVSHLFRSRLLSRASRSFRTVDGEAAVAEVRQGDARLHFRFVPGSLSGYIVTRVSHVA